MRADKNELVTRTGPGTPCGQLLRRYWQPAALVAEFDPALDPRMAGRPVKAVTLMGEELVLFRDATGTWGLLERACPHRGADLAFGRCESDGLRCPFHGWKFATDGRCLETPAEPVGTRLHTRVRQRAYPVVERAGVLFAWLGPEEATPPPLPRFDAFIAPDTHSFAFKGLWQANWLQAFEVGIDPAHPSFLHRYLQDEALDVVGDNAGGKQFRSASTGRVDGEAWPMTRIMREFARPDISFEQRPWGFQVQALRPMTEQLTHVRITQAIFPATFVIPLSETMTITQMHVPVDDHRTYWYAFFTSFDGPLDKAAMRAQRQPFVSLPDYIPLSGRHDGWGFDPAEQQNRTYLGMGEEDINRHDQWAVESMGSIQDRTREHLGTTDKVIMANRRLLLQAIEQLDSAAPPGIADPTTAASVDGGPPTIDGIAPAGEWPDWWVASERAKREQAPWSPPIAPAAASPQPVSSASDAMRH